MTHNELARAIFCAVNECDAEDEGDHIDAAFEGRRYCDGARLSADDARLAAATALAALSPNAITDDGARGRWKPDREAAARAAYKADFIQRAPSWRDAPIPEDFDFDWAWDQSATMPLSGPGFVSTWMTIADAILALPAAPHANVEKEAGNGR